MTDVGLPEIQKRTLEALSRHLSAGDRVAVVDFPSHQNAGDSLIYLGEKEYLKRLGVEVSYVADANRLDLDVLEDRLGHGTVLLHGGGNLGDRWPDFQAFRERVIVACRSRKVIQLPQSVHFRDRRHLDRARQVFASHPGLVLMLREQVSYDFATQNFSAPGTTIEYCPDAAFGVGRVPVSQKPSVDVYAVLRRDSEAVVRDLRWPSGVSVIVADWGLEGFDRVKWRIARTPGRLQRYVPASARVLYPVMARSYEWQARINVRDAVSRLSQGRVIVTDRLHATVLGGLMGVPVVSLDNDYGKVSGVYRDYLRLLPGVRFVSDVAAVPAAVTEALAGASSGAPPL
ncbi:polysaccharide pyruvyl transferase family protein [Geodermatophilus sp. SYSU D00691]